MTRLPRLAAAAPVAALLVASTLLVHSATRVVAPVVARAAPFDVAEAETLVCQRQSGRSRAECDAETEAKALIRDAEQQAAGRRSARPRMQ